MKPFQLELDLILEYAPPIDRRDVEPLGFVLKEVIGEIDRDSSFALSPFLRLHWAVMRSRLLILSSQNGGVRLEDGGWRWVS